MDRSEFEELVDHSDAVSEPVPITEAVLETLGESLAAGQAEAVAKWLPDEYAETLTAPGGEAESLSAEDFTDRVRERLDERGAESDGEILARAGAVTDALATTVPHDELLDLRSQLPDRIGSLFTGGVR
ncbi:DUF2267 domain-containing protein [Halovivax sp.]|uniref:DUF2267 domain-containing protein n=1 Tax=Halovivax sp. TaxID=1935978 RepID=UPI0025BC0DCC|nr:DUF2267 domain-containing protein [Halovivax sp.]